LATYEREPEAVQTTPEQLRAQLSEPAPPFECAIAEYDGRPAGFALFFHNYSTWRGRRGLYLEDLFVVPELRGHGIGRLLLRYLARLACARGCARMEWSVLDWNEPAIGFYRSLGAVPMSEWTVFRVEGPALAALGEATTGSTEPTQSG
jgi:GNAT superfamily N-acetyltransferase